MSQSGDVLERFVGALVQEITVTRPEYLTGPFTVAEIYQDLIPYRSHRDLIGVEMNGDYEDALIRLLSGEGDYLLLDSAVAQQEMQKELDSPNPNTALFREFAAVDVRLHSRLVAQTAGLGPEPSAEVSEAYPSDPEVAGARDVQPEAELELEPETEVELEPEAEVELEVEPEPDLELEPEAEVELALDAEVELELEAEELEAGEEMPKKAAEVGGGRQSEPAATTTGETEPVEVLKPEPGRSSGDGVVGHIETAASQPTAASPPLASFEEPAPDETASTDAETASTDAETASTDAETASTDAETASTDAELGDALTVCHWCREALPVRDSINFCPFCGSDLRPSPCRECGEAMEALWHFCVSCGADVRG